MEFNQINFLCKNEIIETCNMCNCTFSYDQKTKGYRCLDGNNKDLLFEGPIFIGKDIWNEREESYFICNPCLTKYIKCDEVDCEIIVNPNIFCNVCQEKKLMCSSCYENMILIPSEKRSCQKCWDDFVNFMKKEIDFVKREGEEIELMREEEIIRPTVQYLVADMKCPRCKWRDTSEKECIDSLKIVGVFCCNYCACNTDTFSDFI